MQPNGITAVPLEHSSLFVTASRMEVFIVASLLLQSSWRMCDADKEQRSNQHGSPLPHTCSVSVTNEVHCDRPVPICSTGKGFGLFGPLSVTDTMVPAVTVT